jgi:hypothetical protein
MAPRLLIARSMLATMEAPTRSAPALAREGFAPARGIPEAPLFIVARGASDLAARLEAIFGDAVRIVENRRQDPALLPREGREGRRWLAAPAAA